ncbi:MAG: bifunctional D-glycero-beta-D-manno-heptose-7-phosphate kinase/D-glycero-beta-D-manno-heptose 1-phosphate adenylyltransferase HldE [Pseudomonadota bacterium]|nr:bifunctional D-glycero-beta-D-manno-heptose-7-phosphate kinase/D-glycero-beta-D-manno-heptose 1-phosphate adenylyltransferase HldE [Pseudomonadota bacterium]
MVSLSFHTASVLVVGDVILDRYWSGATTRVSPEAPVPVVRITEREDRPGGAANVAVNVASLGARVTLIGITGVDEAAQRVLEQLQKHRVICALTRVEGFTTVTKLRVLSQHQQLLRLDFEDPSAIPKHDGPTHDFCHHLPAADIVVLSDYAKGALTDAHILIKLARDAGKPVVVDPKGRDFTRYTGATIVTPNLKEFCAVVGTCASEDEIIAKAHNLCSAMDLEALLITRGEHGMTLVPRHGEACCHLEAKARDVYDVTGAGDTVVAVLATSLAARFDLQRATALANVAAGLVVAKLGAAAVTAAEIEASWNGAGATDAAVVTEEALIQRIALARARGERIVMTNGCFDVLHAGHVRYLDEARKLGSRLVVAVNDDASVARLKGADRPVNPLAQRIAVLAALKPVDWVVPFSEDTPRRLICRVLPDVLVKGGDYAVTEIAGHDCVIATGGQVVTLRYQEGCSTSRILSELARVRAAEPL